jgi:hypothetical protein
MPGIAMHDRFPHFNKEGFGVCAGIEYALILAKQLLLAVTADFAELGVDL